jgi:tetratricopeptide (TPR) repeat protein
MEPKSAQSDDPLIGRTIGGSYLIQELVGVGGMGRVYKAEQANLGRTVALKVIHPHLLGDDQTVARFYTEARAASRLNHPNSVGVIDFGRTDDGILYLVMELLKGQDLSQVMHAEGPLPFDRLLDILIQVLDGLAEAHALDIVHRDLKPENVIVTRYRSGRDLVKVVDFGLAMIVDGGQSNITRPGLVCGTPDYMAPEQGRGEDVDGRGDLYALGVVLYELLTERLPFIDDTPTKVVLRHIYDPVIDPREVAPHRGISDSLAAITLKALEKDRANRFQSAEEMKAVLMKERERLRYQVSALVCGECGSENPPGVRFCGSCGTPIQKAPSDPVQPVRVIQSRQSLSPVAVGRELLGRDRELEQLVGFRGRLGAGALRLAIDGDVGVGKTRLVEEFLNRAAGEGDLVAIVGPHPSGAPVAYHPMRELVAQLGGVTPDSLDSLLLPEDAMLARAGLDELIAPSGLRGTEERSRAGAVAVLVAHLLAAALESGGKRGVVFAVDDAARCDGLSRETLAALHPLIASLPVLVMLVDVKGTLEVDAHVSIEGLGVDDATRFGVSRVVLDQLASVARRGFFPLYLEQLARLGDSEIDPESAPKRLGEAILMRLQGAPAAAIRTLQAACVLGSSGDTSTLEALLEERLDADAVAVLARERFLHVADARYSVTHPYIAELIEASIPAQARKELHERAFKLLSARSAPLELVAEHAYRGAPAMMAMLQLERMGDAARRRGDDSAAVFAYRRALEVARRMLLESAEFMMEAASSTFSYKLGEALLSAGDLAGADGVLREALDMLGPNDNKRARFYLALGRVALARSRPRDAMRHLGLALELVVGDDPALEAKVQIEIANVRRESRDLVNAANALRRALQLLDGASAPVDERAGLMVALARAEWDAGVPSAVDHLAAAKELATREGLLAIAAEIEGIYGLIARSRGNDATGHFRIATEMFSEAGDTRGLERWKDEKGAA